MKAWQPIGPKGFGYIYPDGTYQAHRWSLEIIWAWPRYFSNVRFPLLIHVQTPICHGWLIPLGLRFKWRWNRPFVSAAPRDVA